MLALRLRGEPSVSGRLSVEGRRGLARRHRRYGGPASLPDVLKGCRVLSARLNDGSELGVFHDPQLGAYTAVVALKARAVSLLPASEHERRLEQWGQLLAAAARRGSAIRRLQVIEHTAPADGDAHHPILRRGSRRRARRTTQSSPIASCWTPPRA